MDILSRGTLRGQLTKLSKSSLEYLNSNEAKPVSENSENFDAVIEELVSALSRLTAVHESIQRANESVLRGIQDEDRTKEYEAIADYSDKYIDVSSRLKTRIDRLKALRDKDIPFVNGDANSPHQVQRQVVRLPKLELKKFNGDSEDWLPFWEQFKVLVHENSALSTSDKFNYLQSSLGGRAATSLVGLSATSACYDSAIALLQEEFGDVAKLVDKHMAALMNLKTVTSSHDVVGLRELYNTVVTNSRSLAGLGVSANNYYVMLKTILVRCLPYDLRVEYFRLIDKSDDEHPEDCADEAASISMKSASGTFSFAIDKGVKDLLKFLKREIQSLERAAESNKSVPTPSSRSSFKSIKTAAGLIAPIEGKKFCVFCKTDSHFSDKCEGKLGLAERKEVLKKEGRCFRCTKRGHISTRCPSKHVRCSKCGGRHVLALCDPKFANRKHGSTVPDSVNLYSSSTISSNVYLQTACVYISPPENRTKAVLGRIVIDSGSQRSYVREDIAIKLDLPIIDQVKIRILPFGSSKRTPAQVCNRVKVCLRSIYTEELIVATAVVVPEICADILPVPNTSNTLFSEFRLADARIGEGPIDGISVLVGSDFYWKVVSGKIKRLTETLTAVHTKFGWAIQGPENENHIPDSEAATMLSISLEDDAAFMEDIRNMWRLESLGIRPPDEGDEQLNIDHYVSRHETYYEASLLWSLSPTTLDNNREGAYQRFKSLVRKLSREPKKLLNYDAAMREMISKGFVETVAASRPGDFPIYFMPHRPVYREEKTTTKLRIVFDASAKSRGNTSLNDHLDTGPNMLPDILTILLNFRLGAIALVADIEKAFLQIMLSEKERDVHRFFWFKDPVRSVDSLPSLQEFRMTRVTFGVKCSPFILAAVLQKHLIEESTNHPEVCKLMLNSFYMDDLVASVNDKETAVKVYVEACELMRKASMTIRKWNSNEAQLREVFAASNDVPATQKVLGVLWFCLTDEISVDLQPVLDFLSSSKTTPSKRKVLQIMARIFDPLGMFSPFIVKVKILFQELWRLKLSWDEELPTKYAKIWNKCCSELEQLQGLTINRRLLTSDAGGIFQLHIFADASPSAYGTVAYLRSQSGSLIETRFICSKNRIAPLKQNKEKQLTLPKLELTAALMAARLLQFIRTNLNFGFAQTYLWTDSKIALYWIRGDISRWKMYVANRVREIRELSTVDLWNHCPGTSNPADYLTRGDFKKFLANSYSWIKGPSWLSQSNNEWPKEIEDGFEDATTSLYVQDVAEKVPDDNWLFDASRFSSYVRLLRITAYVLRFVRNSLAPSNRPTDIFLTGLEIANAEKYWINKTQHCFYRAEIEALKRDKRVASNSTILTLNPLLDENDILRVGSRLVHMESDYEAIYPAILPRSHHVTKLIVLDVHHRTLHGGVNTVLAKLREKFWVPRSRQLIKTTIRSCSLCRRLFCKPAEQPFAPLPRSRLVSARPFETVGIDFAGPLHVKLTSDAITTNKAYIMLLTCSTVRAVHLELVPNLTVESCILALRRFIARRGTPKKIISDNARTFKRAGKEIGQLGDFITTEKFQGYVTNEKIIWQFIVERAPWWGGFWERLVRTIKNALKASIGRITLTCEEMQTTLAEAEAIINNRPLTYMSDDPKDLTPLTPGHFLHPSMPLVSSSISKTQISSGAVMRDLWKARFKLINSFWRRWRTEYVHLLRGVHHSKGCANPTTLSEGDVVLVHDSAVRRLFWKLATVEKVFPGRDGKVRSCEIRLSDGSRLRRAIQMLYPLELPNERTSSARPEDVEN